MNTRTDFPFDNVVPIRKTDHFGVCTGEVTSSGEIIEKESVGIAFDRPGVLLPLTVLINPVQQV